MKGCLSNWRWSPIIISLAFAFIPSANASLELVSTRSPFGETPAGGSGDSALPILSTDGRYVLFASTANNLVLTSSSNAIPVLIPPRLNVFLRNHTNGPTALGSVNLEGTGGGNGDSFPTGLSADGRYALFESSASDLVANDTNNAS